MIHFENFAQLHPYGQDLIRYGVNDNGYPPNPFWKFMALWMSFNGWAACVTSIESDRAMIDALAVERRLHTAFNDLLENNQNFREKITHFSDMWPVYNAKHVNKHLGISFRWDANEPELFKAMHSDIRIKRQPELWDDRDHPSWNNFIRTIYQVRCNLFHGQKSPANFRDIELVDVSYHTLHEFIVESDCYNWRVN